LKGAIFQPAGSTPEPYKAFLAINEEKLWLVKPPGFNEEKLLLVKPPGLKEEKLLHVKPPGFNEEKM